MFCVICVDYTVVLLHRTGLRSVCVLLPLMGVTWVIGTLAVNKDFLVLHYMFAILNSLQVCTCL